jgi:predicted metalloprotease with PDZ domain
VRVPCIVSGLAALALIVSPAVLAQSERPGDEVQYTISVPDPGRRYVQVTAVFPVPTSEPLEIRMSRTSPGRYALHEFVKNVFGEEARDGQGRQLTVERSGVHGWRIAGHDGGVAFTYRVYGDTLDGTYLAVDETHAHMNVPATLVWSPGLERLPARVRLVPPDGRSWRVATQLFPTGDPLVFTAPNLWYLIDSPIEFGETIIRQFEVPAADHGRSAILRVALHHTGSDAEAAAFLRDTERIVLEQRAIFGELPVFEPGHYTFIADYLPWADEDGMEHRNSTILTSADSLANARLDLAGTVAHEFFHAWNVERIRPRSLEPFDLSEAAFTSELWLAEGFTSYYGPLTLARAGLASLNDTLAAFAGQINAVIQSPGRQLRSATTMSRLASLWDGARAADRSTLGNTFLSYYTWGAAIALALDLEIRDRSAGARSLDDFMRALWLRFGREMGPVPGVVAHPYTLADVERTLADVTGDPAFAATFLREHVEGTAVPDYATLLEQAGFRLRRARSGEAYAGAVGLEEAGRGVRVHTLPPANSPLGEAGVAQDDVIRAIDGAGIESLDDWTEGLASRRPGDTLTLEIQRRGRMLSRSATLVEHPFVEMVPAERAGGSLTAAQERFRRAWLGSKVGVPVP